MYRMQKCYMMLFDGATNGFKKRTVSAQTWTSLGRHISCTQLLYHRIIASSKRFKQTMQGFWSSQPTMTTWHFLLFFSFSQLTFKHWSLWRFWSNRDSHTSVLDRLKTAANQILDSTLGVLCAELFSCFRVASFQEGIHLYIYIYI